MRKEFMAALTEGDEGGIRRVTAEFFRDKGYTADELNQIERLEVNQLWLKPGRGCDRSVRRLA